MGGLGQRRGLGHRDMLCVLLGAAIGGLGCNSVFGVDDLSFMSAATTGGGGGADAIGGGGGARVVGGAGGEGGVLGDAYRDIVLSDEPALYWRFGELRGKEALDESPHGRDGAYSDTITLNHPGVLEDDACAFFSGEAADVRIAGDFDAFAGTAPFSVEVWVQIDLTDDSFRMIVNKGSSDVVGREQWGIYHHVKTGIGFERWVAGDKRGVETTSVNTDRFIHLVGTYDGATLAFYLDGDLVGQEPDTRPQGDNPFETFVGSNNGSFGYFVGFMDELAIYDRALTAAEVASHYAAAQ